MINKLINALKAEDYQTVKNCFEDDRNSTFTDYCPVFAGGSLICLYGTNAIEMYFRDKFYFLNKTFSIAEEKIEDDRSATFFACYNGKYVYARLTVEECGENGLIKKAVIRPE